MADGVIHIDEPAVTDKDLDVEDYGGTPPVVRERVRIGGATRAALAAVSTANGLEVDVTRVQGSLPAGNNNIGDVDVATLPAIPAGTNNIGDVDVLTLPSIPAGNNNIGDVDVATLPSIPAGNNNIGDVDIASIPTVTVQGDVAHDNADSGNPVKVGGKAATSLPTAVTAGDRTNFLTDVYGRHFVRIHGPSDSTWTSVHEPSSNTQATTTKSAAGAGIRNVCTGLTVTLAATASAPAAVQLAVRLKDNTTVIWAGVLSLPATAGVSTGITRSGLWIPGTANTAMTLEFSAAGGANTVETVSMEGVTVAE